MTNDEQHCGNCAYWDLKKINRDSVTRFDEGKCQRYPPTFNHRTQDEQAGDTEYWVFPVTMRDTWCGLWAS